MTIETQEGPRTRTPRRSDGMAAVGASPTPPRAQHVPAGPHLGLGTKVQRCTVCEEVFTSPKSGDSLTPDEMRARGLVLNGQGRWSTPGGEWQPRLEVTP